MVALLVAVATVPAVAADLAWVVVDRTVAGPWCFAFRFAAGLVSRLGLLAEHWHEEGAVGLLPAVVREELVSEAPVLTAVLNVPASGSLVALGFWLLRRGHRRLW